MLYIRPGSQAQQLITLLSIVGEYPVRSLHLLGNERVYKALVHKLTTAQTYRLPQTETKMTTRLLTITGKSSNKTIRLYKSALPILDWIHPDASRYEGGGFQQSRRYDRLYGHGYGYECRRWNECAKSVCYGPAATAGAAETE